VRRSLAKDAYDHGIEARVGAAEPVQAGQDIVAAHGEPSVVVDLVKETRLSMAARLSIVGRSTVPR
jgi:hypothetical protein